MEAVTLKLAAHPDPLHHMRAWPGVGSKLGAGPRPGAGPRLGVGPRLGAGPEPHYGNDTEQAQGTSLPLFNRLCLIFPIVHLFSLFWSKPAMDSPGSSALWPCHLMCWNTTLGEAAPTKRKQDNEQEGGSWLPAGKQPCTNPSCRVTCCR
uniref:Uncharacterized protein n=1 Tax=Pavo cristatus TaxID=9049 RepID=A0A8C9FU20_PAVCR